MNIGRMDVSETASIAAGIADRYATAVFDLALEANEIDRLRDEVEQIEMSVKSSDALSEMLQSPIYTREDQERAIGAVADKMQLSDLLSNTLKLMAQKRRLFAVPAVLRSLRARIAEHQGIVTADVTSAQPLSPEQKQRLSDVLKSKVGQDVEINADVDQDLIGGLIVKLGSKMIDTSVRSKLAALQNTMKEVG